MFQKLIPLFLSAMSLFSLQSKGEMYRLQVVGNESHLHGAFLSLDANDVLHISHGAEPCTVSPDKDGSTLALVTESKSSNARHSVCALQGPSGKGEFYIQVSPSSAEEENANDDEGADVPLGIETHSHDWQFLEDSGRNFLRRKQTSKSHWIAVKESGLETWTIWWYEPNPANMDDFEEYVPIDIEMVPVSKHEHNEDL